MRNFRAVAAALRPLIENPEIASMAEICEILQALPDDAARLRVMRWSFARFGGEEFKRPLPTLPPQAVTQHDRAAAVEAAAIQETDAAVEEAAQDFAGQVSELKDLFPRRALALNKLRPA